MIWLHRLNPFNYLFGRIFLWFWLATLLMVLSAIWLTRQFSAEYEIQAIRPGDVKRLEEASRRLQNVADRHNETNLSLLLNRVGHRSKVAMILVEASSKDFVFGMPRQMRPGKEPFNELLDQPFPLGVKTSSGTFHGPVDVTLNERQFKLFVGKPLPPGFFRQMRRQHPGLFLSSAVTVSAILCALLAWSLIRPIRQVQRAVKSVSAGDLSARVSKAADRHDELGQLAKDFNSMSAQLEESMTAQKRLLADISHELRSPLARLQVAIGIAHQQKDPEAQLERIEKEAHQIEHMLGQVLKLSKLEAMQQIPERETLDLTHLLYSLLDDANFEAQSQNKTVLWGTFDQLYTSGDRQLLNSAIENVLRNAVKYASTKVEVSMEGQAGMISIHISDDGPGIPQDELTNIFTPFYRLSASRNRNSGGVGLGLAIAKQAVAAHQGNLMAHNHGQGLTVTIQLMSVEQTGALD